MAEGDWIGPPEAHLRFLYSELKDALARQVTEFEGLDRKAIALLTPVGLIVGFGVASADKIAAAHAWAQGLFIATLCILGLALASGVYTLRLRAIKVAPSAEGLWPEYASTGTEETLADLCSTVADAYKRNGAVHKQKEPWLHLQFWLLLLGLATAGMGFILQLRHL